MLRRDRSGRWRRSDNKFASASEVARARKFIDASGRKRNIPKTAKARAKAKSGAKPGSIRYAFQPKDAQERAKRQEGLRKKRGRPKLPRFAPLGRTVDRPAPRDKERRETLESMFGIKLRTAHDFRSLAESQAEEIKRDEFFVKDPYSEAAERSIERLAREIARKVANASYGQRAIAIATSVFVGKTDLSSEMAIVSPSVEQITGAILKTIMGLLTSGGYYVSDGGKYQDLRKTKREKIAGVRKAKNLTVEVVAYSLEK